MDTSQSLLLTIEEKQCALTNYSITFYSFGLTPAEQLNVPSVVANQSVDVSLPLATTGPVQRMEPLTNLQVYKYKTELLANKVI